MVTVSVSDDDAASKDEVVCRISISVDVRARGDEIHLEVPFYGSRRIRDELDTRGQRVNRKRVQRLMREMGIRALYPKRRTVRPARDTRSIPTCSGT